MIAIKAVYHLTCLTGLYRRAENVGCDTIEGYNTQVIRAQFLNEILDFIKDKRGSQSPISMVDVTSLYDKRLAALGFPHITCNQHALERILSE